MVWKFFDFYLIFLFVVFIGIVVGFWMIWFELEMFDDFEEFIWVFLVEDGID